MLEDLINRFYQLLTYDRSNEIHNHKREISILFHLPTFANFQIIF